MRTLLVVSLLLVACGKQQDPKPATEPPATAFRLGEATAYEMPANKPMFKLHADGKLEFSIMKDGTMMPGGTLRPDGTVEARGKTYTHPIDHGTFNSGDPERGGSVIRLDGTTLTFHTKGLADATATLANGEITIAGDRKSSDQHWRIEASDPAVARTLFVMMATYIAMAID